MCGLREKYAVEIEYLSELYARGATPSVLATTVATLGVVDLIPTMRIWRAVWALALSILKEAPGYERGRVVVDEVTFDDWINAALARGIADGTAHLPGVLQSLAFLPGEEDEAGDEAVRVVIDGVELRQRVYAHELAMPSGEAVAGAFALSTRHHLMRILGETRNDVVVLDCGCGSEGCWPLEMRVTVGAVAVVWDAFARPHRPLGLRFVFERGAYDAARSVLMPRRRG